MFNWKEPLPKHTKVDYYECYAKIVLEEICANEFNELEIADKPDLQSIKKNQGIEVTIAIDKDELKAESLHTDICYGRVRNLEKAHNEIKKCGCELSEYFLFSQSDENFDLILGAFDNKLNKLNKYKLFKKNYLFIFSDILPTKKMLDDAIEIMIEKQLDKERKICKVYILVPGCFYIFDLYKSKYESIKIDSSLQCLQANKARELVESYEK